MKDGNDAARRKALLAGAIGNFVEWYDFALYGFFATTIATLFFPKSSPTAALLSTFAIFGVSFLIRPLGAIVFGHFGDRVGRRPALLLSVILMSSGTIALGLLPTYAQVGIAAPVLLLLCRLVQGFSAGGEYSGANIFLVEHAPAGRRGLYVSIVPASTAIATSFGALVAVAVTSTTTSEQLASWGWRVPFLVGAPLALIGLYLRLRVDESPVFDALRTEGHIESAPVVRALKVAKRPMVILIGWTMSNAVGFYLLSAFLVSYLTTTAKFNKTGSLLVLLVAELVATLCCLLAGYAIDRVGRKRVAVASALGLGAWAVPTFALLQHTTLLGACLIVVLFVIFLCGIATTSSLVTVELFPPRVRTSASSLAYQISYTVFGGSAPYLATWLVSGGHLLAPGYYLAGLCAVSAVVAAIGIGNRAQDSGELDVMQAPTETSLRSVGE